MQYVRLQKAWGFPCVDTWNFPAMPRARQVLHSLRFDRYGVVNSAWSGEPLKQCLVGIRAASFAAWRIGIPDCQCKSRQASPLKVMCLLSTKSLPPLRKLMDSTILEDDQSQGHVNALVRRGGECQAWPTNVGITHKMYFQRRWKAGTEKYPPSLAHSNSRNFFDDWR